ncbi:MAG: bifunctional DNA-formamidopyrimidine glycosylase/DNA-(apurinic or apyrimidinic site) lyase [Acetobacteraceae bacterium]|nr:bifunctional DNA-formamidopyrimidine glycosylase/DNA-(apurinic or apyrimidinic site) lyase [Acetobacteraceae bacterium]
MPELPEVETVMRGLRARLEGRTIIGARVNRADLRWPLPPDLAGRLLGRRAVSLRRRGKYILLRLSDGNSLLLHLGMSGRIMFGDGEADVPGAHEHVVLCTDDGARIRFVDPRRFGSIDVVATAREDSHPRLADLGPEPLDAAFTPQLLEAGLRGRRTAIKTALLDQTIVAGLGNIYVCEALFRARLSPFRSAHTVIGRRAQRLVPAIRETLEAAIEAGGSSLRDYVQPSGELGYFQHAWRVYGRAGLPCERCTGPPACTGHIHRAVQAGRSTFFCRHTQR